MSRERRARGRVPWVAVRRLRRVRVELDQRSKHATALRGGRHGPTAIHRLCYLALAFLPHIRASPKQAPATAATTALAAAPFTSERSAISRPKATTHRKVNTRHSESPGDSGIVLCGPVRIDILRPTPMQHTRMCPNRARQRRRGGARAVAGPRSEAPRSTTWPCAHGAPSLSPLVREGEDVPLAEALAQDVEGKHHQRSTREVPPTPRPFRRCDPCRALPYPPTWPPRISTSEPATEVPTGPRGVAIPR